MAGEEGAAPPGDGAAAAGAALAKLRCRMRKGLKPPPAGRGVPLATTPEGVATTIGVQRAMLAPEEARGTGALGPPGDPHEESDSLPESREPEAEPAARMGKGMGAPGAPLLLPPRPAP